MASLAFLVLLSVEALAGELPLAYRDGPYYDDLMGDITRLRMIGMVISDTDCTRDITSAKPCPQLKKILTDIAEKHDLPADLATAKMLQAYADGDYLKADRLYASIQGFELPEELKEQTLSAVGAEIASFGVAREKGDDTSCTNDLFGPKPCAEAMKAFATFAAERGLEKNRATAEMFRSYVQGDPETGDQLYAAITGMGSTAGPRNEILAEVRSYGVPPEEKQDTSCENNYYAAKPCLVAVAAWRDFSRDHGLELTPQTADLFRAYLEGDEVTGDKLYAAAKGISIAELLRERGVEVEDPEVGNPLYVPIHP